MSNITLANDLIFTEVNTIDVFEYGTGKFMFSLDELQDYSITHSEESKPIRGRNGRIVSHIKNNKSVSISGTNGIVSSGLLSLQTGGKFGNGITRIMWTDYAVVQNNQAQISFRAVGTYGAEIASVVAIFKDGTPPMELEQDSEVSEGKFAYTTYNRTLTFTGLADGTDIIVHYMRNVYVTQMVNDSERCSCKATLYINGMAEDKCSNVYHVQFFFPCVDFSGEFALDFSGNQTVHKFEAAALTGRCGSGGSWFYMYNVFGLNSKDVKLGSYYYVDTNDQYYLDTNEMVYVDSDPDS